MVLGVPLSVRGVSVTTAMEEEATEEEAADAELKAKAPHRDVGNNEYIYGVSSPKTKRTTTISNYLIASFLSVALVNAFSYPIPVPYDKFFFYAHLNSRFCRGKDFRPVDIQTLPPLAYCSCARFAMSTRFDVTNLLRPDSLSGDHAPQKG